MRGNQSGARCAMLLGSAAATMMAGNALASGRMHKPAAAQVLEARCARLAEAALRGAPVQGLAISAARWQRVQAGAASQPAHCLIEGHFGGHVGVIGGPYSIGFRMRLPAQWNHRFLFQGGGGSNGVIGDATGPNGPGNRSALERGYAVIAQDSGHDNGRNAVADHGGVLAFGFDPQARRNYGHASLKPTNDLAHHLLRAFYGRDSVNSFFWGCSKGGQEGMAFVQRYPEAFDGIVAAAPGFALPRAALAEAWDTQAIASILRARGEAPTLAGLKMALSAPSLALVRDVVLATCDADDGAVDGMITAIGRCTAERVVPALRQRSCTAGASGHCLDEPIINALARIMGGVRTAAGKNLYAPFPWDSGIAEPGWRVWKAGLENGPPALNVLLGAGSLASVFTTAPTPLPGDPEKMLAWQLSFDFERDAERINAIAAPFTTSAWQDVGMQDTDLSRFRARGGKLIVPHGMSDPVFSAYDTIQWWNAVDRRMGGQAARFVRVFPVPGMNHCAGGPATDRFDSLAALERWVIENKAPDSIAATAGPETPWPGRKRPLCPYPSVALPTGGSFSCGRLKAEGGRV
ncbi:tannase/feruloyl esterase family alpha/beta hydrolase [Sphingomonas sp. HT-1]|uniref:tannase/feruloyl esterase family alpha/beta hydrolase n=1 Tax=unclassified Sphingomonas TaxID=196159 RepID=UPI000AB9B95E|nr:MULTISPECIES: tannase/feruloyl esterase family alpha/beta hydrolase [unclassified Sphingomonas]